MSFVFDSFERARSTATASMRPSFPIDLLLLYKLRFLSQGNEDVEFGVCLKEKKSLNVGVRTGFHYIFSMSVCLLCAVYYVLPVRVFWHFH